MQPFTTLRLPTRCSRRAILAGSAGLLAGAATLSRDASAGAANAFDPASFTLGLSPLASGFDAPVWLADPADGSGRLFVVEQTGRVRILRAGADAPDAEPLLDISDLVSTGSEQGLLSVALHPDFANTPSLFICYTDRDGNSQIDRLAIDPANPDRVDMSSRVTILSLEQPYPNHNGGLLLFGLDGMLYAGFGDGGGQGDPEGNGQRLDTLLGKILRLDVDRPTESAAYGIPADNPFVGRTDALPEIWAYGLRNPWRFSFDRATGDCFIADVGQNRYEEVDICPAGESGLNFGWNIQEAERCYDADSCDGSGLVQPIFSYSHDDGGCSVTGGYVYRGNAIPALQGVYLCADYCSGLLWGLGQDANGGWVPSTPIETGTQPSSFAEDAAGELYLIDLRGTIYRITG